MANVSLKGINKVYPSGNQAVFDFNLEIQDKEFIVLVGPSGCGKSTTLRMVAGLEEISSGELRIDGELMNDVPSKNRGIAMVFQSYALYPHMSVFDNMAFGLKLRKVPKDVIKQKIEEVAVTLGLSQYLQRKPKDLSGGQRQRVALGRAIVRDAKVYLYDEPLSNLDAKLRVHMRTEIARLHKALNATSIYVTHDQIEAMTMANRIVVMKDGRVQQIGTPEYIYAYPENMFVGGFIGTPPMNFINGKVTEDGYFVSETGSVRVKMAQEKLDIVVANNMVEKPVALGIRPEDINYGQAFEEAAPEALVPVDNVIVEMLGHEIYIHFNLDGNHLIAVNDAKNKVVGESFNLVFDMERTHVFDLETTMRLRIEETVTEEPAVEEVVAEEPAVEEPSLDNQEEKKEEE